MSAQFLVMGTVPRIAWAVGLVAWVGMTVACGSKKDSSLGGASGDDGQESSSSGGSSSGATSSAPVTGDDDGGSGAVFTSSDAAPASVVFDCEPGTYTGMFNTMVSNDAGGIWSLFSIGWAGTLSITLQGKVDNTGQGEIPEPTLTIAPGAKLDGTDMNGGSFTADMTGSLDCPTKKLSVTIANGAYSFFLDAGSIPLGGTMTATYDGNSSPPHLSMGTISVSSPQVPQSTANGSWNASLQ
ncbi:MAG TPA: hypothetical protein VHV30_06575 [Polyangiaceae bacterium]|jgi:activator of HSP90 ATPase|nr:hypothetical protein [Polyangiaceae bacterium]